MRSGVTGFQGFTASGTIVFAGDPAPYSVTLAMLGGDKYRLDVTRRAGVESTIYNGSQAIFRPVTGRQTTLSIDVACLGLIAFPRLLAAGYPHLTSLVVDQNVTSVGGQALHRITFEDPASDNTGSAWHTQDLYFDPQTHYLALSTTFAHRSSDDAALYMMSTGYDDYRQVSGHTLPFRYTQSLNGSLQWTIQLSSLDLTQRPDSSLFQF